MTRSANRWLMITAASVLAIGMSACHKTQTATDAGTASSDASAAAPAATDSSNAMTADNSASPDAATASNDAGSAAPSQ